SSKEELYNEKKAENPTRELEEQRRKDEIHKDEIKKRNLENNFFAQEQGFRRQTYKWVRRLIRKYLIFVLLTFVVSSIANFCNKTFLSDSVLIALLTATT